MMPRAAASSLSRVTNLWTTAGGAPSTDSTATVARRPSLRPAIWPAPAQPDNASPNTRTPMRRTRRLRPTDAASMTRQPDPLCIDFPARPAIELVVAARTRRNADRRTSQEEWITSLAAGPGRKGGAALICERYGIDVTPVVRLAAVGRPAVAEKPRCIGIGAVADVLHAGDAGGGQAGGDVAGEVEQRMARPRGGPEKARIGSVIGLEAGDEFRSDLVVGLPDHRPERGRDPGAIRSAPLHGGDGRLEHAGRGAAPSGMGGTDDTSRFVAEQHRADVGGGDPDREARHPRDDGVGAGTLLRLPRALDRHHVGGMDLIGGQQAIRRHAERRRHARAVLRHLGRGVVGPGSTVEARIDAVGDAALAREEGVADTGERGERGGLQGALRHVAVLPGFRPR